jgi:hypothetical protein
MIYNNLWNIYLWLFRFNFLHFYKIEKQEKQKNRKTEKQKNRKTEKQKNRKTEKTEKTEKTKIIRHNIYS